MSLESLYREEILDHAKHPRNRGTLSLFDADGRAVNTLCGDEITIQLKWNSEGRVEEIVFSGTGCILSQASASMLTEFVKGKASLDLKNASREDYLDSIELHPTPSRLPCVLLSFEALQEALTRSTK